MSDKNEVIINEEEKIILRKAIDIAEKNGFKGHIQYLPVFIKPTGDKKIDKRDLDKTANDLFYFHGRAIVFSTSFIIAFFPEGEEYEEGGKRLIKDWKYHTNEMYKVNPIRYIESYL